MRKKERAEQASRGAEGRGGGEGWKGVLRAGERGVEIMVASYL